MKKKITYKNDQLSHYLNLKQKQSEEEKKVQALLLAAQTENINVNSAFKKVLVRTNKQDKKQQIIQQIIRIAAILAIPLLMYSAWSVWNQFSVSGQNQEVAEQQFTSPTGMRSIVILPDGSKVWLNAESSMKYNVPFGKNNRKIYLEGEAFFSVAENKKSNFIVHAANIFVEVTGTRFNVKAYPQENMVSVALQQGSVKLQAENATKDSRIVNMEAGDFYTVRKGTHHLQKINLNIDQQIAWHQNILVLNETPLDEVAVLLERWYGVKVIIKDKELLKYKIYTTFENEPLNRVLELLELSSPTLKIDYKPGKHTNETGEKNYSIVTISKK